MLAEDLVPWFLLLAVGCYVLWMAYGAKRTSERYLAVVRAESRRRRQARATPKRPVRDLAPRIVNVWFQSAVKPGAWTLYRAEDPHILCTVRWHRGTRTWETRGEVRRGPNEVNDPRFARKLAFYRAAGGVEGDFVWPWKCLGDQNGECGRELKGNWYSDAQIHRHGSGHDVVAAKVA